MCKSVVREPRSVFPVMQYSRCAFAFSDFRSAGQECHFKAGTRAPRRLAPRLFASVLCWPDLQAGHCPLFILWTELELPLWNIPTVLGASLYCCIFLWRGSDQHQTFLPAHKFRAQSFMSATGHRLQSPASISCRHTWGRVGEEVVKVRTTAITGLPLLSSEQCLAGRPDAGFF